MNKNMATCKIKENKPNSFERVHNYDWFKFACLFVKNVNHPYPAPAYTLGHSQCEREVAEAKCNQSNWPERESLSQLSYIPCRGKEIKTQQGLKTVNNSQATLNA